MLADPNNDWDGDRASNLDEFYGNGNPCLFDGDATATQISETNAPAGGPCPDFSSEAVMAEPNGDWDGDRVSNSDEFFGNSQPCVFEAELATSSDDRVAVGPCPGYSAPDVLADPDGDWDGDTATQHRRVLQQR